MVTFPERRFPGGHFPRWDNFLWLIYRRTLNTNNTLYKFIPRWKANWLALLTPQGYAKCPNAYLSPQYCSNANELRNIQDSTKTASVSTFLSWPSLINYTYSLLLVAACYLLQCGQPTRPTETKSTKSKQRNDSDDRYLILQTTGTW